MKQINHNITKRVKTMAPAIILIAIFIGLAFTQGIQPPDIEEQFEGMEYDKYPFAHEADSILGVEARYGDYWCELANPEFSSAKEFVFDYSLKLHNDTVWLYDMEGRLIRIGNYNKLLQYIEEDNL